jgi:hypothetical protein
MEFDPQQKTIVLFERHCHATDKSEAIVCARRCRSSRLTRWWTEKNNREKWRAEEGERHKGSLTPKPTKTGKIYPNDHKLYQIAIKNVYKVAIKYTNLH